MDSHGNAPWRADGDSSDESTRHDSRLHGRRDPERQVGSRLDLLGHGKSAKTAWRSSWRQIDDEPNRTPAPIPTRSTPPAYGIGAGAVSVSAPRWSRSTSLPRPAFPPERTLLALPPDHWVEDAS